MFVREKETTAPLDLEQIYFLFKLNGPRGRTPRTRLFSFVDEYGVFYLIKTRHVLSHDSDPVESHSRYPSRDPGNQGTDGPRVAPFLFTHRGKFYHIFFLYLFTPPTDRVFGAVPKHPSCGKACTRFCLFVSLT